MMETITSVIKCTLGSLLQARRRSVIASALTVFSLHGLSGSVAQALSLEDGVLLVLESHPEISAAEHSKQAIEFELDQARSLLAPRVELYARGMSSYNDGTSAIDRSAADDTLEGYEVGTRISQTIWKGNEIRSEIERQAYRVDAAALRVLERSEFLGLEAVRMFADVHRSRDLLKLGRQNLAYHRAVLARIETAFAEGVLGVGDLQQAQERVFLAEDILIDLELDLADAEAFFVEVVGAEPDGISRLPDHAARLPQTLDAAMSEARRNNPTVRFLQLDVAAADALSRSVDATRFPEIALEAEARYGEDVNSFEGEVAEAQVGIIARYTFQGNLNRGNRQEHVRRASEARSRLLAQARIVDREVRQAWSMLGNLRRRVGIIERQARLAADLRESYEAEFEIGNRTLLDVLNTQNTLFQAQVELTSARALETFTEYRLLAASGRLLDTLGIAPPEDAAPYAVVGSGAPTPGASNTSKRFDARSFGDWRRSGPGD